MKSFAKISSEVPVRRCENYSRALLHSSLPCYISDLAPAANRRHTIIFHVAVVTLSQPVQRHVSDRLLTQRINASMAAALSTAIRQLKAKTRAITCVAKTPRRHSKVNKDSTPFKCLRCFLQIEENTVSSNKEAVFFSLA